MTTETKARDIETSEVGTVLTLKFSHGRTIRLDVDNLPASVRERALVWGIREKLTNAAAMSKNTDTGKPAPISEKFAAVERVAEQLRTTWNTRAEAGPNILLLALCAANPSKTREVLAGWLAKRSKAECLALQNDATLKPHIEALQKEAAMAVNSGALLDELASLS